MGSETVNDYKEVTEAEKTALQTADAKWVEPDEAFFKECEAAGVVYNTNTGYFELNTLNDITTAQMRVIMRECGGANYLSDYCHTRGKARTYLPMETNRGAYGNNCDYAFAVCANLEVLDFSGAAFITVGATTFKECNSLRKILNGIIKIYDEQTFASLPALEELKLSPRKDTSFAGSPNLSLASVQYMVSNNANGTTPITITLHPTAYARVTDETKAAAAAKQITIAST